MMCETGLALAKACSQVGIVSVGTNALDRNVSGNITISEMRLHALGAAADRCRTR